MSVLYDLYETPDMMTGHDKYSFKFTPLLIRSD